MVVLVVVVVVVMVVGVVVVVLVAVVGRAARDMREKRLSEGGLVVMMARNVVRMIITVVVVVTVDANARSKILPPPPPPHPLSPYQRQNHIYCCFESIKNTVGLIQMYEADYFTHLSCVHFN